MIGGIVMATNTKQSPTDAKQHGFSGAVQTVERDVRPLQAFWTKFSNDWSMNFAAALAYNLMMAMFPIAIAILSILGFFLGTLDPHAHDNLVKNIQGLLPAQVSGSVINQIEDQLRK